MSRIMSKKGVGSGNIVLVCIVLIVVVFLYLIYSSLSRYSIIDNTRVEKKVGCSPKCVYIIRTHIYDSTVASTHIKLLNDFGYDHVYVLFDDTKAKCPLQHRRWNDTTETGHVICINESECFKLNKYHKTEPKSRSGRVEAHVAACVYAIGQDTFDYMWLIEFDVVCNGSWKSALQVYNDTSDADFLCKSSDNQYVEEIITPMRYPDFYLWDYLNGPIANVPEIYKRACFFPIVRISNEFTKTIIKNLSINSGFCEVYFPTLALVNGMKLEPMKLTTFGVFRYRPVIKIGEIPTEEDDRLYHPVKKLN